MEGRPTPNHVDVGPAPRTALMGSTTVWNCFGSQGWKMGREKERDTCVLDGVISVLCAGIGICLLAICWVIWEETASERMDQVLWKPTSRTSNNTFFYVLFCRKVTTRPKSMARHFS
jgi:hypothetical protein